MAPAVEAGITIHQEGSEPFPSLNDIGEGMKQDTVNFHSSFQTILLKSDSYYLPIKSTYLVS